MTGMVQGVFRRRVSAVLDRVNITIWKGTTMENTQAKYTMRQNRESTRAMYQAAMEVNSRIRPVDSRVITVL